MLTKWWPALVDASPLIVVRQKMWEVADPHVVPIAARRAMVSGACE